MAEVFQVFIAFPGAEGMMAFSPADGAVLANYAPASGSGTYHAKLFQNGVQVGSSAPIGPLSPPATNGLNLPPFVVQGGVYTLRVFADGDDNTVIAELPHPAVVPSNTVAGTGLAGFVAKVPNVWTARNPFASGGWAFGLANVPSGGATVYAGLFNVTTNAYVGGLVALSGVAGLLPDFSAAAAGGGTFAIRLCTDSAGANVLATGASVRVAASLPSVVQVAGLSGETTSGTISLPNAATAGNSLLLFSTNYEASAPTLTPPAGFTKIADVPLTGNTPAYAIYSGPVSALTGGTTLAFSQPSGGRSYGGVYLVETNANAFTLTTSTAGIPNQGYYTSTVDGATAGTLNLGLAITYCQQNVGATTCDSNATILAQQTSGAPSTGAGATLLWSAKTAAPTTFTVANASNVQAVDGIGLLCSISGG